MIQIPINNLYANAKVIQFLNGEQILIREKLKLADFSELDYHTVRQEEDLTKLAYQKYKNKVKDASKYWWLIADVNEMMKPYDISDLLGKEIAIPNISELK